MYNTQDFTPAARGLEELYVQNLHCFVFKTDRQTDGDTTFNSYVENLHFFVFQTDGRMDRQTDRQTDGLLDIVEHSRLGMEQQTDALWGTHILEDMSD